MPSTSLQPYPKTPHNLFRHLFVWEEDLSEPGLPNRSGKKEIFDEDQAIEQYPDSFHLRGPRAISAEVPEEKILNYELAQIAGLDVLHLISEPTDMPAPYNPEPTVFKRWEPSISAKQ